MLCYVKGLPLPPGFALQYTRAWEDKRELNTVKSNKYAGKGNTRWSQCHSFCTREFLIIIC